MSKKDEAKLVKRRQELFLAVYPTMLRLAFERESENSALIDTCTNAMLWARCAVEVVENGYEDDDLANPWMEDRE